MGEAGTALPAAVRREAELRLGQDFSHVRIHDGDTAARAAASVNAAAFTVGNDVVLGSARFSPATAAGRALLHHELTHVVQQRSASPTDTPELDPADSVAERQARGLGTDRSVVALPVQRIQCAPEEQQFSLGGGIVDAVGESVVGGTAWPFIKAALEGLISGVQSNVRSGKADEALRHLSDVVKPWNAAKFTAGYMVGLAIGLVSPITDLVKGLIGLLKLGASAAVWLAKWSPAGIALSPERQRKIVTVVKRFDDLAVEIGKSVIEFAADPAGAIKKLSGFIDDLMGLAVDKARELGKKAADAVFGFLTKPFFELGKEIGEVIGALLAQVLLLVFSDAIGNLITKGASFIGKAAEFVAGKAVQFFEWAKGLASEAAALLRNAVKGALKMFQGLVSKALKAFEELASLFVESEGLLEGELATARAGGRPALSAPNIVESRVATGARTSPDGLRFDAP